MAKKSATGTAQKTEQGSEASVEELAFERAYAELLEIVATLEDADLTLEQALALHARGKALATYCTRKLDEATLRIRQIGSDE